jgi:hypothetical protein
MLEFTIAVVALDDHKLKNQDPSGKTGRVFFSSFIVNRRTQTPETGAVSLHRRVLAEGAPTGYVDK